MEQVVFEVTSIDELISIANGCSPRSLIFTSNRTSLEILALYRGTYMWGYKAAFSKEQDLINAMKKLKEAGFTEVAFYPITEYFRGWM